MILVITLSTAMLGIGLLLNLVKSIGKAEVAELISALMGVLGTTIASTIIIQLLNQLLVTANVIIPEAHVALVAGVVGVGLISSFATTQLKELGLQSMASTLQTVASVTITGLMIPLIQEIIKQLIAVLS
jgi:hypothetical protein